MSALPNTVPASSHPSESDQTFRPRLLKVGLFPGYKSTTPFIRLNGKWLREAGFFPQGQVKVKVMMGKLVLEFVNLS